MKYRTRRNMPYGINSEEIEQLASWLYREVSANNNPDFIRELQLLMMGYECAIKEVSTKFEVLNAELALTTEHNPIHDIKTRVKSAKSIVEKLKRNNLEFNLENIEEHLNDIAGIRIIVGYIDDIYSLVDMILHQDDIELISCKDYIANPKENGYRSLHLVIRIPVFFSNEKRLVKVEVQIRTIAMDFWASLEHSLRYKNTSQIEDYVYEELNNAARQINETDNKMMELRKIIEDYDNKKKPE